MSLNFDFSTMIERLGQAEYDRITDSPFEKGKWHPVTDALIWRCMSLEMRGIDEKNVDEFIWRCKFLQSLTGTHDMANNKMDIWITEQDIRNHIGLSTNVTQKTRDQWLRGFKNHRVRTMKNPDSKTAWDMCAEAAKETETA